MSVFNVQNNLSTLLSKAYNTETKATTANGASTQSTQSSDSTSSAGASTTNASTASAEVTLGATSSQTGTYTAQGLMQQLRQYQLSNAELLFSSDDDNNDDTTGLTGLMGTTSSDAKPSENQDWVSTISANPDQAAVMVETTTNNTLNTILGN